MSELDGVVLKHRPEDFLVRENMVVTLRPRDEATHQYLLLRKCGYTTMEACRIVADALGVEAREVSYGGLKDEDAITEQLVGVPKGPSDARGTGNLGSADEPTRWLELQHYGYGTAPLQIGMLEGNGFHLMVRNLTTATARIFEGTRKLPIFFLNYYDIQRFGVPNGPKRTHLVGAAMLNRMWPEALRELAALRAPESRLAGAWTGDAEAFFRDLDPRTAAFYLAAHESHRFNAELACHVEGQCPNESHVIEVEGLEYRYLSSPHAAAAIAAAGASLPYTRYAFVDGVPTPQTSRRTTVIQAEIKVHSLSQDESYPGRQKVGLRFFLPSGCYATAAIRQMTYFREDEIGDEPCLMR